MDKKDTLYARMLSGDLRQSEIDALKASGEWDELEKILKYTSELELPEYDKERTILNLKSSLKEKNTSNPKIHIYWKLSIAASFILLIASYFFLKTDMQSVEAAYGSTKVYQFADNSSLTLNDGSSIKFNEKKWDQQRMIELTGEAMFQVQKGKPFIVQTKMGAVEVLGTSFNVRNWGEKLTVDCYTGKVKVSSQNQEFILTKGESVEIFTEQKGKMTTFSKQAPHWTNSISKFNKEKLNIVFEELERQYNIKISSPIFDTFFTGSITHTSLERALYQSCTPMGLSYKIDADQKNVTIFK